MQFPKRIPPDTKCFYCNSFKLKDLKLLKILTNSYFDGHRTEREYEDLYLCSKCKRFIEKEHNFDFVSHYDHEGARVFRIILSKKRELEVKIESLRDLRANLRFWFSGVIRGKYPQDLKTWKEILSWKKIRPHKSLLKEFKTLLKVGFLEMTKGKDLKEFFKIILEEFFI